MAKLDQKVAAASTANESLIFDIDMAMHTSFAVHSFIDRRSIAA